ncbi:MAG: glycine cleavage system protein GcvH [Candidatus Methylomirabilis sp.]|nr:glycine cleavage system protein GcvH [Deltaproteobacteria bacterium]
MKYTKEHEWAKREGDTVLIGITDYAQEELGDIVFVELPEVGEEVSKDESFGSVESVKTVSDLYAPVSGKIVEVNADLAEGPETINSDPYGDGWLIKVKMSDPKELDELMDSAAYQEYVAEEEDEEDDE